MSGSLTPWLGAAAVAVIAVLLMGVAPSTASAFWEETVLNPGKTDLTGPAKTIIEKPTFLPDTVGEAGAAAGEAEAGGVAAVFEGAGVLPALGSALSFGVGAGVGSVICHAIGIEGCWFYGSESADPAPPEEWTYVFEAAISIGGYSGLRSYEYYATSHGGSSFSNHVVGLGGSPACSSPKAYGDPGGYAWVYESSGTETVCSVTGVHKVVLSRSSMANRELRHVTDAEAESLVKAGKTSEYPYTAPSNWSEKMASAVASAPGGSAQAHVGEKIASEIEGSGVKDPYSSTVTVPSCSGEAWIECKADLEELELVPERSTLTWETAEIELEPDAVTELSPSPGTELETGTKVVVTTNPDEAAMPVLVPAPKEGETYDDYVARLAPQLKPHRVDVGEASIDPSYGPNVVLRTDPVGGTRVNPEGEHSLEVQTNPATAPAPGAGVGEAGSCEASIGSVDFSPLNQPVGSRFPFGVIGFFVAWVGEWSGATYSDPEFSFRIIPSGVFGSEGLTVTVDLSVIEPAMEAVRIAFLLASFVGLLWFLGTAAMKVQGDSS